MKKVNEKISQVLDIEPIDYTQDIEVVEEIIEVQNEINDDAEYARQNLRNLIEKGNDAVDNIIEIAKQSEHPRAFEVVAGLLKNLADMNKDLMEIQKRKKELSPKQSDNNSNINVDKAVFVGSTAEFVKLLKSNK